MMPYVQAVLPSAESPAHPNNTGKDPIYAPFTGKFVRVRKDSSHESYLESLEPVEFANGVVDYMTLTFMHDDVLDIFY